MAKGRTRAAAQRRLIVSSEMRELLGALNGILRGRGVETYVVGGFLRDALLGRDSHDVDLAVAADPLTLGRELAEAFDGHYFPLAEEQHLARVLLPDRGVHIDLLPLRAGVEADLPERDYTIDAMAASLEEAAAGTATVIDPTGGEEDLQRGLVRVIREDAFRSDPLRPLRGVRLAVALDFSVEKGTARLIAKHAPRLGEVAVERRRDELMRILATPRAGSGLRLLDKLGLLELLLPEVTATRGVEQPKEHHWDVFDHLLEAVGKLDFLLAEREPEDAKERRLWRELWSQLSWWWDGPAYFREQLLSERPRAAVLKLGGLLHDVAKPETKSFDETGRMRFFGHSDAGAEKAGRIMRRLRFSRREVALVQTMVKAHLRPVQMGQQGPPTRRAMYRYFRDCADAAIPTLFLSLADHLATVGPRVRIEGWRQHVALVNYILTKRFQEEETTAPAKLVRGDDLIAEFDLTPGPIVGRLLEAIHEAHAAGEIQTREEALALARSSLARRGDGEAVEGGR